MLDVQIVVRRVSSTDEDQLAALQDRLECLGAEDAAVIFFPNDKELGMQFQIKEEVLGELLQPVATSAAA